MPRVVARLFSLAVEAKTEISLASAQGSVDRRKSPGRQARIGSATAAALVSGLNDFSTSRRSTVRFESDQLWAERDRAARQRWFHQWASAGTKRPIVSQVENRAICPRE
jgi:ligand-binding sensor domain-containing protein